MVIYKHNLFSKTTDQILLLITRQKKFKLNKKNSNLKLFGKSINLKSRILPILKNLRENVIYHSLNMKLV